VVAAAWRNRLRVIPVDFLWVAMGPPFFFVPLQSSGKTSTPHQRHCDRPFSHLLHDVATGTASLWLLTP
jgi:hypothetical protein